MRRTLKSYALEKVREAQAMQYLTGAKLHNVVKCRKHTQWRQGRCRSKDDDANLQHVITQWSSLKSKARVMTSKAAMWLKVGIVCLGIQNVLFCVCDSMNFLRHYSISDTLSTTSFKCPGVTLAGGVNSSCRNFTGSKKCMHLTRNSE